MNGEKDDNVRKGIWEKLLGAGKDRYLILLGIGLMCVVIAGLLEHGGQKGQNGNGGNVQTQISKQGAGQRAGGDAGSLWLAQTGGADAGEAGRSAEAAAGYAAEKTGIGEASIVSYASYYQRQLETLLSKMDGVGKVSVFVTLRTSEEIVLERNNPYSRRTEEQSSGSGQSTVTDTQTDSQVVFYENADGRSTPIVVKRYAPKVEGIVVLAQGASDPRVSANITQFLMALFELPEHKIKVANYHT